MNLAVSKDKPIALITGASSGVSYELSKQFAQHGYDLIIVSKNPAIVETGQICWRLGAQVDNLILNLNNHQEIKNLLSKIKELERPLDAIALNIGEGEDDLDLFFSMYLINIIMKEKLFRNSGRILLTTSATGDLFNTYKEAFDDLRSELKNTEIVFTSFALGSITETKRDNSAILAQQGFEAMSAKITELMRD